MPFAIINTSCRRAGTHVLPNPNSTIEAGRTTRDVEVKAFFFQQGIEIFANYPLIVGANCFYPGFNGDLLRNASVVAAATYVAVGAVE